MIQSFSLNAVNVHTRDFDMPSFALKLRNNQLNDNGSGVKRLFRLMLTMHNRQQTIAITGAERIISLSTGDSELFRVT